MLAVGAVEAVGAVPAPRRQEQKLAHEDSRPAKERPELASKRATRVITPLTQSTTYIRDQSNNAEGDQQDIQHAASNRLVFQHAACKRRADGRLLELLW